MTIASLFTNHMSSLGKSYLNDGRAHGMGASTDMGNVCYEIPGFHCAFSVGGEVPGASPHNPNFATAAGTKTAFVNAMECAKGMAMTVYDLLTNDQYSQEMWDEFRQEFAEVKLPGPHEQPSTTNNPGCSC